MKKKLMFIIALFLIAFFLNIIWEISHSPLYMHPIEDSFFNKISYPSIIIYASFIDALLIIGTFLFLALIFRKFYWDKNNQFRITYFILITLGIAIFIEVRVLFTERWAYNEFMPTIFGIGITPLMQLAITGFISIYTTKYIMLKYKNEKK